MIAKIAPILVRIFDRDTLAYSEEFDGPVELGRQTDLKEGVYTRRLESGRWRVIIAGLEEHAVSRRHAILEPLPGGMLRLTNMSGLIPLGLPDGSEVRPNSSVEVPFPVTLGIGKKTVRLEAGDPRRCSSSASRRRPSRRGGP